MNAKNLIVFGFILSLLATASVTVTRAVSGSQSIPNNTPYNASTWDANMDSPTKNAVRDEIEIMLAATSAAVSDTAYDATSWDGVTTVAPSKNAVRDKIASVDAADALKLTIANNLSDLNSASTARSNLGLTALATTTPAAGVATFLATPTSANLATAITDETGSGAVCFATSPTLVTPNLGTPTTLVGTNISGTGASFTAGNVTTNANLTGDITSVGNATTIGSGKVTEAMQVTADNTTQNFSTSKHGYVPKGTNVGNFLKDDGTWAAASASLTSNYIGYGVASVLSGTSGYQIDTTNHVIHVDGGNSAAGGFQVTSGTLTGTAFTDGGFLGFDAADATLYIRNKDGDVYVNPTATGGTIYFQCAGCSSNSSLNPTNGWQIKSPDGNQILKVNNSHVGFYNSSFPLELNTQGTRPACASGFRGGMWIERGGGGVADVMSVCTKDAADAYAWHTITII